MTQSVRIPAASAQSDAPAMLPTASADATVQRWRALAGGFEAAIANINALNLSGTAIPSTVLLRTGYPDHVWVGGDGIRLPLQVRLDPRGGEVLAVFDRCEIFGVGQTPAEAIVDLRAALVEHLHALRSVEDELTDDLRAQRDVLQLHLG